MIFDKTLLFADGLEVPATASKTTNSKVIDLRLGNYPDGCVKVYAQILGDKPKDGAITTKLQTSSDGSAWTDLVAFTQDGTILCRAALPITGKKRYLRLAFAVGSTALSAAVKVKAGLVDQFDLDEADLPPVQTFPPLEDVAAEGEAVTGA